MITVPPTIEHAAEVMCAGKDSVENACQVACADKGTALQGTTQSSCYGVTTNEHAVHTVPDTHVKKPVDKLPGRSAQHKEPTESITEHGCMSNSSTDAVVGSLSSCEEVTLMIHQNVIV